MKELKVHQTSDLVAFSYYAQENLERSDVGALVGSVSSNGDLAYLAHGAALEVVKIADGSRRSACNLGAMRENMIIKCITELAAGYSRRLLLGLEVVGRTRHGLLCIYDMSMSKITKAIWMPEAVTVITVIEDITEIDSDLATLCDEHSKSLIVVGCKGGQVLVTKIGELSPYDQENDLSFPAELEWVTAKSLLKMGGSKIKSSSNYCLDLSVNSCNDGTFNYQDPTGKLLKAFKQGQVAVSSLLFMKQASLLVAGYSFGCFSIWDLQNLQPIFSSSYSPGMADITHIVFQEPENDPRYCCYLLVGRSPSGLSDLNIPTTITLYQLVFEVKETSCAGYYTYRDLEAVCKRFDHQLTSDSNHLADLVSIGSRIITCSPLPRRTKQQRLDQSGSIDAEGKLFDTTLSYIVWESPPQEPEETHSSYHLGLFDINRWYQLQMPCSIGYAMYGSSDPVCPFFAFYSLNEVSEAILPDSLVDCFINTKEIISFNSTVHPTLEQNFWPSALTFNCTCLAERGIVKTEMLGLQRQILADLVANGSEVFNRGYQLINLCWSAGLVPKLEVSRLDDPQIQFECLMSVAIEHGLIGFILGCIRDWSRGEITNAGNCLRSVLQWAWRRVIKAKGLLDEHYIKLFYAETSKMDDVVIRSLSNCAYELKWLSQILSALKESPVSITDEGISGLSTKLTVTNCIHRYADAILFFLRTGLLPESTESKQVNLQSPFDDRLFIDEYCKVIEDKIRENGSDDDFGWDGQYPPPSVNVVCKSLLLDISRDDLINFLYYWILDAAECLELDKLAEGAYYFFKISKTQKNVIEGLWDIDHNRLESGVEKLMEFGPELLSEAMRTVYRVGNKSLACHIYKAKEMLSPGDIDWKFCIKVLAENMALYEAYKLQAKYRESDIAFEAYQHFLEECMKNNLMPKLFDFYLTEEDEDWLYQFLENKGNPLSKELLVVFCIKRHRYAEAMKHGACFNHHRWTYGDKSLFGGVPSRRAILHMTNEIILPLQRRLISFPNMKSDMIVGNEPNPAPLSSSIARKSSFNETPHSGSIFKILQSVGANRSNSEAITLNEPYNLPFVRSAKTPITRKRREHSTPQIKTDESFIRPEKKSILKPAISEATKCEIPTKRRKHLFYGSEAMKLLQTPPVIKSPKHIKSARNFPTPASILKSSKTGTKKDEAAKSVRKRVVISDQSFCVSPTQLPESPSKLPESPSCLTPEVFKLDAMTEDGNTAIESEKASVSNHHAEEVAKSLDFEEKDELRSRISDNDTDIILQLDATDHELVASPNAMEDRSICLELETDDASVNEPEAANEREKPVGDEVVLYGVKDGSGMDVESEMEQVVERMGGIDDRTKKGRETDDKVVTAVDDGNNEGVIISEEDIIDEKQLDDQLSLEEEIKRAEDRIENEEKIDSYTKGTCEDARTEGGEEQYQNQLSSENKQESRPEKLLEDNAIIEPLRGMESEIKSDIEEKLESPVEVDDFTSVKPEWDRGTDRGKDHLHEEHEGASSKIEAGISDKEKLQIEAGNIEIIVPMESKTAETERLQPIFGLDLGCHLTSSDNLNTSRSDIATPDAHLSWIDSSNFSPLSSTVGTPDETSTSHATVSSGLPLRTHRIPGDRGALQQVFDKTRGDLKVVVGKTDVTREMRILDSSFESQGGNDVGNVSTASANYSSPLVFDNSTQELDDTTSRKETKMPGGTNIVTRRKAKRQKDDAKPPSPIKTRKSHSPVKSKRRSFYTPRSSPADTLSGTTRVTRSSTRKIASVEAFRGIEKNTSLSLSVSESPISFAPVSKSERQTTPNRSKRNSLQSPLVNTHSMTLRSRSRPRSFVLK